MRSDDEWTVPDTIWCVDISGSEQHFDEPTFKELVRWLDSVVEAIGKDGEHRRFDRFTTDDIYGMEMSFCWADVRLTFISTPETRRRYQFSAAARKQERIEQGFRQDDE